MFRAFLEFRSRYHSYLWLPSVTSDQSEVLIAIISLLVLCFGPAATSLYDRSSAIHQMQSLCRTPDGVQYILVQGIQRLGGLVTMHLNTRHHNLKPQLTC